MNSEYHHWMSPRLGHGFELKVYGWSGRPMAVFPSSRGRFYQYEDFGMVEACRPWLEAGQLKIFALDGIDWQTWWNEGAHPADKARRHQDYDACIMHEAVPFIHAHCGGQALPILTTGCSFGAYHAANFLFRHPDVFSGSVCLSGVYSLDEFVGGYCDDNVFYNDPTKYLPGLNDPWFLDRLRRSRIILCAGQGAWEDRFAADTRRLSGLLTERGIDHWFDLWGPDAAHDWPWWRQQIRYFLGQLLDR